MSLSCTTVEWRGLALSSQPDADYAVASLLGWDETPGARYDSPARPTDHGRFRSAVWADERVVTLGGQIISADRDALLHDLHAAMGLAGDGDLETLTVTRAGRTLTAAVALTAFRTPTTVDWGVGAVPFAIEWRASDPFRYGAEVTDSTAFAQDAGWIRFPLVPAPGILFGATPPGWPDGLVTVANDGTAEAWPVFDIAGPVSSGGVDLIVGSTVVARYAAAIAPGATVRIDTATGLATLGSADVSQNLTVRNWTSAPPGGSLTVRFAARGSLSSATLTARLRPTYW